MTKSFIVFVAILAICQGKSVTIIPNDQSLPATVFTDKPLYFRSALPGPASVQVAVPVQSAAPVPVGAVAPVGLPGVFPAPVSAVDVSEFDEYKAKFGKVYFGIEDEYRRNVYFATKEKIAVYDELFKLGLTPEKLVLNVFADYTRDELFTLRSILDKAQDEWNEYKIKYEKVYDDFEDKFRKTVYFINKDKIEAHNKLYANGFSTYLLGINQFTDYFYDELSKSLPVPNAMPVPAVQGRNLVKAPILIQFAPPPPQASLTAPVPASVQLYPNYYI